jgi:hypothetical protein
MPSNTDEEFSVVVSRDIFRILSREAKKQCRTVENLCQYILYLHVSSLPKESKAVAYVDTPKSGKEDSERVETKKILGLLGVRDKEYIEPPRYKDEDEDG